MAPWATIAIQGLPSPATFFSRRRAGLGNLFG